MTIDYMMGNRDQTAAEKEEGAVYQWRGCVLNMGKRVQRGGGIGKVTKKKKKKNLFGILGGRGGKHFIHLKGFRGRKGKNNGVTKELRGGACLHKFLKREGGDHDCKRKRKKKGAKTYRSHRWGPCHSERGEILYFVGGGGGKKKKKGREN